ncbi:hypothetical protein LCM20_17950 [Halobacillus litoralis]|uniref:SCO7613 C-terminal domain-containing membrane protein n=1 Tax=Halobacillus litoralis TaxID=45668 RepID=UPI001CD49637|nr:hypothetical protein [Halobacillus litoralis]MCA0972483.1 hypothetical protein [Halobacillus litoralis]
MSLSDEKKVEVFDEQLLTLWRKGYVTSEEYSHLSEVNKRYVKEHLMVQEAVEPKPKPEPVEEKVVKPSKPKKEKKVKTAAQVRERNITWTLILGVALLLITGLVVATSQWEQMGAGLKVVSISFVSLFFLALSYGTGRFLRIHQTAFAFLTLGSLLIPVVIIAIGYFELLGSYLSLFGEGRHLLGLMGTLLPLPLYIRHAVKHQSRFYVWVSLVFVSLSVGFALGALPLSVDAFYLGLMLYNAALLLFYVKYQSKWTLYMKEIPLYAQLNLVLSTLLMLLFFESEVFYSFNLLLTASVYMAMVFVYKTKEYQFVFSVMLVYAIYQLVENSPVESLDATVYALAGLLYLGLAYGFRHHAFVEKVFRYTSAVVSFCAFLYISVESILLRGDIDSWTLFFGYVLIMVNYIVLSNIIRHKVFPYMATLFFYVALWQLWSLVEIGSLVMFIFSGSVAALCYAGMWTRVKWLQPVKVSTFYLSLLVQLGALTYALNDYQYTTSAVMLAVISALAYFVRKSSKQMEVVRSSEWGHPVALSLSALLFYNPLVDWIGWMEFPLHASLSGLLLLAIHFGWKKAGEAAFSKTSFYIGQLTYVFAMSTLLINDTDPSFVRPSLFLIGILLGYWLVRESKQRTLWLLVSIVTLAFYFSLLDLAGPVSFTWLTTYAAFAPVLLLLIGEGGRRYAGEELKPYFYWVAHSIQPLIVGLMLLNQTAAERAHPVLWIVPLAVYAFSAWQAVREWEKKLMLYAGFSTGLLSVVTASDYYGWFGYNLFEYSFLATSIGITALWLLVSKVWRKRVEWYIIPFSILGLLIMISGYERMSLYELGVMIAYVSLTLFFIHQRKWSMVAFLPLLMTLPIWGRMDWSRLAFIAMLSFVFFVLLGLGRLFHQRMVTRNYEVDAYSWTALVYIGYLYTFTVPDSSVWIRVLPVVFVAVWLAVCAKKWQQPYIDRAFYTGSAISVYAAYLMIIRAHEAYIADVIQAEVQSLPVLGLLFLLGKRTWSEFKGVQNQVRWAVLLLLAAYLVIDAIESHTIWDAWIIGALSLISMVAGLQMRIKSYFFVGMGVLIFNVLYQTRPYWGNMPWWVYLLIAGLVLIGVASYNEWQKQRSDTDKPVERKLKRLWVSLKRWN